MKMGIVTINDNSNYGNRLQNYAMYNIAKNYGQVIDTIVVCIKESLNEGKNGLKQKIKKIVPLYILSKIIRLKIFIKAKLSGDIDLRRSYVFSKFTSSFIPRKLFYVNKYEDLYKIKKLQNYDYIFTGSDQVWNPNFAGNDYYFLTFVPPEKRIGCIASIGVTELPEEQKRRYASLLKEMKYISVREESAVQIIEELIHRKVDCFLDPVLLLEREKWENIMKPPAFAIPKRYILSFFLGKEPKEEIQVFAKNKNLKVVHMNQKEYKEYYLMGPENLLYMIKNAAIVLTDSFHVTAFSMIFHSQFYVFRRKQPGMDNMFSRMETLLKKFQMIDRIQGEGEIKIIDDISPERYMQTEAILSEERRRFDKIMRKVLNLE